MVVDMNQFYKIHTDVSILQNLEKCKMQMQKVTWNGDTKAAAPGARASAEAPKSRRRAGLDLGWPVARSL